MYATKGYSSDEIEIHESDISWTTIPKNEAIELALEILKIALTS
jgi:hypothetical protein